MTTYLLFYYWLTFLLFVLSTTLLLVGGVCSMHWKSKHNASKNLKNDSPGHACVVSRIEGPQTDVYTTKSTMMIVFYFYFPFYVV